MIRSSCISRTRGWPLTDVMHAGEDRFTWGTDTHALPEGRAFTLRNLKSHGCQNPGASFRRFVENPCVLPTILEFVVSGTGVHGNSKDILKQRNALNNDLDHPHVQYH